MIRDPYARLIANKALREIKRLNDVTDALWVEINALKHGEAIHQDAKALEKQLKIGKDMGPDDRSF